MEYDYALRGCFSGSKEINGKNHGRFVTQVVSISLLSILFLWIWFSIEFAFFGRW